MALTGTRARMPSTAQTKEQASVSLQPLEAEIVAANMAVQAPGMQALDLWEVVLEPKVRIDMMEDN